MFFFFKFYFAIILLKQWKLYPICYTNEQLQWTQQHAVNLQYINFNIYVNYTTWSLQSWILTCENVMMPHFYYFYHFFITISQIYSNVSRILIKVLIWTKNIFYLQIIIFCFNVFVYFWKTTKWTLMCKKNNYSLLAFL